MNEITASIALIVVLLLLLGGGVKSTQKRDIKAAIALKNALNKD